MGNLVAIRFHRSHNRVFTRLRKVQYYTLMQCVPLATERGIPLVILPLMRILHRNLKRIYLIVYEM